MTPIDELGADLLARATAEGLALPWCWRDLGGRLALFTAHSGARVVLNAAMLNTRDGKTGRLRELREDDAVAELILFAVSNLARHLALAAENERLRAASIPILTLHLGDDGTWLNFTASTGKHASIRIESLSQKAGSIIGTALREWCVDRRVCERIDEHRTTWKVTTP